MQGGRDVFVQHEDLWWVTQLWSPASREATHACGGSRFLCGGSRFLCGGAPNLDVIIVARRTLGGVSGKCL